MIKILFASAVLSMLATSAFAGENAAYTAKGVCEYKIVNSPENSSVIVEWSNWTLVSKDVNAAECIAKALEIRLQDNMAQYDRVSYRFKIGHEVIAKGHFHN